MPPAPPDQPMLSVDPFLVAAAAQPLLGAAGGLRAAVPALNSAWGAAAHTLAAHRTGQALAACQGAAIADLGACVESVEAYAAALQRAASLYRGAESAAVPAAIPAQRVSR